nr:hypothetical protein [Tanacetum cinerariifolium]
MFDKAFKRVNTFEDFRTELVEGKEKRAGTELEQKITKKKKSPRIVDWKIHKEGKKSYYQIVRADRKSQMYMIFSQMLKIFDREDLEDLYKLSMQIYILVEKKYPLTPPTFSMMLKKKLQIDYESKMTYQLHKLIKKQHKNLIPASQSQVNVPHVAEIVTTSINELDMLFSLMFDENFTRATIVVSKSSVAPTADAFDNRHQQDTTSSTSTTISIDLSPLIIQTTPKATIQAPTQVPIVTATENNDQAEVHVENAHMDAKTTFLGGPLKDEVGAEILSRNSDSPIPSGIFINQAKYAQKILKKHGMTSCDSIGTPMATKPLDADLSGTPLDQTKYRSMDIGFELTAFLDSDHAGCLDTRKSTSGGIQFLGGDKLVSWSSKKYDCTSMSIAEAETEYQLVDLFTKALPKDRFKYLVGRLGMRCLTPTELKVLANETA